MTLRITLYVIAAFQLAFGGVLIVPGLLQRMIDVEPGPEWVNWMLAICGARALGLGYGMAVAAQNPLRHRTWIVAMVGVQTIDWVATVAYVATGAVTLAQVTTAAFLPVLFVVVLGRHLLRPQDPSVPSLHQEAE